MKLLRDCNTKEDLEKEDITILKKYCHSRKKGYRMITMELRRDGIFGGNAKLGSTKPGSTKPGNIKLGSTKPMNHKKVYRLMKKYNLLSRIRKKNPYRQIAKANQEHKSMENILQRNFSGCTPLEKLGTDISYLYYNGTRAYISILKDMVTGEIISHKVSPNLSIGFVLETIRDAKKQLQIGDGKKHELLQIGDWKEEQGGKEGLYEGGGRCIIQSDQGFHYTHPSYQYLLKDIGLIQSMSRRGNCLDNAPTESFFGHMKDELEYAHCKTFTELQECCDAYIQYYNTSRPQWNRKKMTPVQYRNHLLEISKQKHIV